MNIVENIKLSSKLKNIFSAIGYYFFKQTVIINMSKKIINIIIFLFISNLILGQNTVTLRVKVDNIKTIGSDVFAAVYKSQDDFNNDFAIKRTKIATKDSSAVLVFHLPADSVYSVAVFQDIDGNDQLTTKGMMKAPNEPIGFSNNKLARFGPPDFKEVAFKLKNDTTIRIHIINSRKEFYHKIKKD